MVIWTKDSINKKIPEMVFFSLTILTFSHNIAILILFAFIVQWIGQTLAKGQM